MSRCLVFSATGLVALAVNSAAGATDLSPAQESHPAPQRSHFSSPATALTWDGVYVGDHVGGTRGDLAIAGSGSGVSWDNKINSAIGGGQVGYNYQRRALVYGVEMDIGGMNLGHTTRLPGNYQVSSTIASGLYSDLTARLGYAYRNILWYGKGGFALYDGSVTISGGQAESARAAGLIGWTVGGGVEYKLSAAWSMKAEFQYFEFGAENAQLAAGTARYDSTMNVKSAKIGVNYHLRNVK